MPQDLPEHILVERAKNGDRQAFESLFASTHAQVFNFLLSLGLNYDQAADITQETYVRAWGRLRTLRFNESFISWLHQIARNLVKDFFKHNSRHPESSYSALSGHDMPGGQEPGELAESRIIGQAVRDGIAALPEDQRLPIVMHHVEGLSVAEISQGLGVTFGTVLSRLARGRATLARRLQPFLSDATALENERNVLQD